MSVCAAPRRMSRPAIYACRLAVRPPAMQLHAADTRHFSRLSRHFSLQLHLVTAATNTVRKGKIRPAIVLLSTLPSVTESLFRSDPTLTWPGVLDVDHLDLRQVQNQVTGHVRPVLTLVDCDLGAITCKGMGTIDVHFTKVS